MLVVGVVVFISLTLFGHRSLHFEPIGEGNIRSDEHSGISTSPRLENRYTLDRGIEGDAARPVVDLARLSWELDQHNSEGLRAADMHDAAMARQRRGREEEEYATTGGGPRPPAAPPMPPPLPAPPDPGRNQSDWPVWWFAPFFDHTSFGKEAATTVLGMVRWIIREVMP